MQKLILPLFIGFLMASGAWYLNDNNKPVSAEDLAENEEEAGRSRAYYDYLISRDPVTGEIPDNIRQLEIEWVKTVRFKRSGMQGSLVKNTYSAVGPTQNGGRTRALAFDVRFNGTTNRVVLSGGVQGGVFRSEDGGLTWAFVHPANEVRSVTCLAQDTRPGFQDTWYAGTGEAIGSAYYPNALVFGFGLLKSTDNGKTWSKIASTVGSTSEFSFDNSFDFNHNIAVHPTTGDVYVAAHQSILKSTNGGTSWNFVLRGSVPATNIAGITEILINKTGTKLFAAFSGKNPDRAIAGVWQSTTGDLNAWTRIAGGVKNAPDSVAGWRAYNEEPPSNSDDGWGRIALGFSANEDMYVLVENYKDATNNVSEADLFRANISAATPTWSANLGSNLVAKLNGTEDDFYKTQGGYDMEIIGHPTNNQIIYAGGVSLYRSSDGFTTPGNTYYMGGNIGGRVSSTIDDPDRVSHVDFHRLRFDPTLPNRMIAASDGGLAITPDATSSKVTWTNGNSQYQTIQYYHVGIDPVVNNRNYFGGAQDNNTTFRDQTGIFGTLLPDSNDHYLIVGGDGGQTYLFRTSPTQPYLLASVQEQRMFRAPLFGSGGLTEITPQNIEKETFVTYFHLDEDNPSYLYFPSNDTLYRTTSPSTVTSSSWTRMGGVDQALSGQIFSLATTKGNYTTNSMLYMGTANGRIFRLKDPANADPSTAPVNISPSFMPGTVLVKDIAVNPRNHDTVIAVVSNYNAASIYWTGNATSASPIWDIIEGNLQLPSVRSCEIVVTKTGVEYYVGTTVGLFSTTTLNGSSTVWAREDGGPNGMMNTSIVQSLAYRWKDNTMIVGTHGNGMFATYIGNAIDIPTGVNDPIRDDKNFIVKAFPTITNNILNYEAGTMLNIRSIQVQVHNIGGQLLYNKNSAYGSGSVNVGALPSGTYILTITSNDRKYQFVRRFSKS
jgi:hypothetical protein